MKKNRLSFGWCIGIGCLLSILIGILGSLAAAIMLEAQTIKESDDKYAILIVLLVSSFTGSFVAQKLAGKSPLPACAAVGAGYMIALLCCTALFFGGQYSGVWVTGLVILGGCGCAVLLGTKWGNRANTFHRKYRNR